MAAVTPFDVLRVTPDADLEVIRAAYRALARKYHPDTARMPSDKSHRLMVELNWAMEELDRDLAGWRRRAGVPLATEAQTDSSARVEKDEAPQPEPFDVEKWRRFTDKYRRPKDQPLGWRAWIGSDVVCNSCGCTLNTYVFRCPDCGELRNWKRSVLHTIGDRLAPAGNVVLYLLVLPFVVPFCLGLLLVPVVVVLSLLGLVTDQDSGWPWEWGIRAQVLTYMGVALELGIILGWKHITRAWKKLTSDS